MFGCPSARITNNTLSRNTAFLGGGLAFELDCNGTVVDVYNNIIWGNTASQGSDLYIDNDDDGDFLPAAVNLFNNDFDQSAKGTFITLPFAIDPSNLNNLAPLFVDALNGDYHVRAGSPVIDKGNNTAPALPPTDKDGHPRIFNRVVDMGAFEFAGAVDIPQLTLSLNATAFRRGDTLSLTATVTPGMTPIIVDAYVAIQLPDRTLLFLQGGGSLTTNVLPIVARWSPISFAGQIFIHTFSGGEPSGGYTWLAAFTEPGTLNFIGGIVEAPFAFTP